MTGRYGTNRADDNHEPNRADDNHEPNRADDNRTADESTSNTVDDADKTAAISGPHRREWRRWVVETVTAGTGSVVPVDQLVDTIADREPDEVSRSLIRAALITDILPAVECEPGVEYDADRQVVINYGY